MEIGDVVISKEDIGESVEMFPKKGLAPNVRVTEKGSKGIVKEVFPSGWGIVKIYDGVLLLVSDVHNKFKKIEEV